MNSIKLKDDLSNYLKSPQSEQTTDRLLDTLSKKCEIRKVLRRNEYEKKLGDASGGE